MQYADIPLITCISYVAHDLAQIHNTVSMFLKQVYPRKELLILHNFMSSEIAHIVEPEWRNVRFCSSGDVCGNLNANVAGQYVAIWEAGAWYHHNRLEHQLKTMKKYAKRGVISLHTLVFVCRNQLCFNSPRYLWPQTLLIDASFFAENFSTILNNQLNFPVNVDSCFSHIEIRKILYPDISSQLYIRIIEPESINEPDLELLSASLPLGKNASDLVADFITPWINASQYKEFNNAVLPYVKYSFVRNGNLV